jgi:hypothetical protein
LIGLKNLENIAIEMKDLQLDFEPKTLTYGEYDEHGDFEKGAQTDVSQKSFGTPGVSNRSEDSRNEWLKGLDTRFQAIELGVGMAYNLF